jgi:uncharacterized cysteine cluster protein YcgN (CxxCxxCC family)
MALKVKAVERLLKFSNKENDPGNPDCTGCHVLHGTVEVCTHFSKRNKVRSDCEPFFFTSYSVVMPFTRWLPEPGSYAFA